MKMLLLPKPILMSIVLLLSLSMLGISISSGSSVQDISIACADGQKQADENISGFAWFAIGCIGGFLGYLVALSVPNPPMEQLMGKSPEYVKVFTECYRVRGKRIKRRNALYGALVELGILIITYLVILSTTEQIGEGCTLGQGCSFGDGCSSGNGCLSGQSVSGT